MDMGNLSELDHGAPALSNIDLAASDRDNALRHRGDGTGHVESHFVKANSPDGRRALWIKHTVLAPQGRPDDAVAELWAIAFDEHGTRKLAAKQTFPLGEAAFGSTPFSFRLPTAELTTTRADGSVAQGDVRIAWALVLDRPSGATASFRPYPLAAMYERGFPRSKSLTPGPDLRLHGHLTLGDERWEITGWRGAQGHNWGKSHAHAYAWAHANTWCEPGRSDVREGVWLEAISGRVRLGKRLVTPFLTVAGLAIDGEVLRFDGPRAMLSRQVKVRARSYELTLARSGATLHAAFHADTPQFAGLRYDDPDGGALACLNAKIAHGTLTLTRGRTTLHLTTTQAALELGSRDPAHGIALLA